jgi:hypothetical protein
MRPVSELLDSETTLDADDGYKWKAFAAIGLSFFTMVMTMSMVFVDR